jgi:outer membrane immunogenic protein
MAVKAPPAPAPPVPSWTGVYFGGHIGGGWSEVNAIDRRGFVFGGGQGSSVGQDGNGFLGGVQAGYNWQVQNWVLGIEGEMSWANIISKKNDPFAFLNTVIINYQTDWLATATGRAGYAWNNLLIYGKAGGAWVRNKNAITDPFLLLGGNAASHETHGGWTAGAGLEYAFSQHVSGFVEYDFIDINRHNVTINQVTGPVPVQLREDMSLVKVGLNYKL